MNIDYNNQNTIENIETIEFVACNTNKNFCDKNGLSKNLILLLESKNLKIIFMLMVIILMDFVQFY